MNDEVFTPTPTAPPSSDINIIKIPLLVSGILNAITAVSTIFAGLLTLVMVIGCFILPIGVLFAFLSWWEIRAYIRLNDPNYPNEELQSHIKTIAILEIVAIIFGSISSLVCGILVITNINKLDK